MPRSVMSFILVAIYFIYVKLENHLVWNEFAAHCKCYVISFRWVSHKQIRRLYTIYKMYNACTTLIRHHLHAFHSQVWSQKIVLPHCASLWLLLLLLAVMMTVVVVVVVVGAEYDKKTAQKNFLMKTHQRLSV